MSNDDMSIDKTEVENSVIAVLRQAFAEDADLPYPEFLRATARAVIAVVTVKGETP